MSSKHINYYIQWEHGSPSGFGGLRRECCQNENDGQTTPISIDTPFNGYLTDILRSIMLTFLEPAYTFDEDSVTNQCAIVCYLGCGVRLLRLLTYSRREVGSAADACGIRGWASISLLLPHRPS
jgi:hypothetical protein